MFSGIIRQLPAVVTAAPSHLGRHFFPATRPLPTQAKTRSSSTSSARKRFPPVDNANSLIKTAHKRVPNSTAACRWASWWI